jgi:hypothetical protein
LGVAALKEESVNIKDRVSIVSDAYRTIVPVSVD